MNSTQEPNSRLPEETGSSQQLPSADDNANLTSQTNNENKGAIPKTKPAVKIKNGTAKKPTKINNNIEDVPLLVSPVQNDILKLNGLSNGISMSPYFKSLSTDCEIGGDASVLSRTGSFLNEHELDVQNSSEKSTKCDIDPISFLSKEPCCSYNKDVEVKVDTIASSDEDELLSLSDDGCIYTYKGDQVADLPTSFFSLDMPPLDSPNPPNRENSSPEMDFLEMDFDPGPSGEADSDSISNGDLENTENLPKDEETEVNFCKSNKTTFVDVSKVVMNTCSVPPKEEAVKLNGTSDLILSDPGNGLPNKTNFSNVLQNNKVKVIKSCKKMPWTCSMSERTVTSYNVCSAKRYHCTKGDIVSPSESGPLKTFAKMSPSLFYDHLLIKGSQDISDSSENKETIMIWSEQEAYLKQISQIGPSACGATAVLNVLSALKLPIPPVEKINDCITTRLRSNSSPLTEYLLSRCVAGTTHRDLIECLTKISNGHIYARFFHMYPERVVNLHTWLGFWIKKGAVPIATLNLQKCTGGTIPDAWHHQMIYGVGPKGIFLTNPIECVEAGHLWPQLCSESVLLIRREDVLCRWNLKTDLPEMMKVKDYRWRRVNVVGQVANLIYESRRELRFGFRNTSHIKIPASYSSGITLAIPVTSPACSLLKQCPQLPLLQQKNANTALFDPQQK